MRKQTVLTAVLTLVAFAVQAMAAGPAKPEPKKHHKVFGIVMVVGGVALVGLSAVAFAQPCPIRDRANQIAQEIGRAAPATVCGSSVLQKNKIAIGSTAAGAGTALIVGGVLVMRQ